MLRFGIVGLGRAAGATVPAIVRHPDTQVVAAADTNPTALDHFRAQFSSRAYTSVEALCHDPEVDAVYIATPTHLHTEHVLCAVSQAKLVISEKPLAITLEDADRMIEAVEAAGVQMIVASRRAMSLPFVTYASWCEAVSSASSK